MDKVSDWLTDSGAIAAGGMAFLVTAKVLVFCARLGLFVTIFFLWIFIGLLITGRIPRPLMRWL